MALQDAAARRLPTDVTQVYRAAPHNIEAEQALLGAILVNNEAFYRVSVRRSRIVIGEDMVNVAYDAPVDFAPRTQIEDAERRLYELAENGKYDSGFQRFASALTPAVDMAARAYQRDGKLSGLATGLT